MRASPLTWTLVAVAACDSPPVELRGATIAAAGDQVVIVTDRRVGVSAEVDPVDTLMSTTTAPGTAVAPLAPVTRDGTLLRGRAPVLGGGPAGAYLTWYDDGAVAGRGAPLDATGAVAAGRVTPAWLRAQPVAVGPRFVVVGEHFEDHGRTQIVDGTWIEPDGAAGATFELARGVDYVTVDPVAAGGGADVGGVAAVAWVATDGGMTQVRLTRLAGDGSVLGDAAVIVAEAATPAARVAPAAIAVRPDGTTVVLLRVGAAAPVLALARVPLAGPTIVTDLGLATLPFQPVLAAGAGGDVMVARDAVGDALRAYPLGADGRVAPPGLVLGDGSADEASVVALADRFVVARRVGAALVVRWFDRDRADPAITLHGEP